MNARTGRLGYEGALVRGGAGFGCLHPWPELGDPTVEDCLADFAGERRFALVKRTMACLAADGEARQAGRSLFEELEVPPSHATLPALNRAVLEEAVARGFDRVKVKAGRAVRRELAALRKFLGDFPDLRWRLDFNGTGRVGELVEIFDEWSDEECGKIDFLEDPVAYGGDDWRRLGGETGMPLANDREVEAERGDSGVLVIKPAVNEMRAGQRVVVTSYLDHPLGQVFAAWEAARAGVTEVCGLQTHGVFARDPFTEALGPVQPRFQIPGGTGLGFDDLLEGLPWKKVKG